MNLLFLTSGRQAPSSRFRIHPYVPHLRSLGHRCVVRPSHPPQYEQYRALGWRPSQRLRRLLRQADLRLAKLGRFDVAYVERELFDDDAFDLEQRFRRACGSLVLDIDDAVFLRHPEKFSHLAALADEVIVGNEYLAQWFRRFNERLSVVPTVIDLERYPIKPDLIEPSRPLVLGWTGTSGGLTFLASIAGALRHVARRRSFRLYVVADKLDEPTHRALDGIDVQFVRWNRAREIADLHRFDIGLMPLPDNEWTRHKCGLKLLQYWAVGIPAVASPVGVNRDLVRHGENGMLADSPGDWITALEPLLDDAMLRKRLGQAGRATVEATFTVRKQLPHWLHVVRRAADRSSTSSRLTPPQ